MTSYIKIIRPLNAFLASIGVILGFWLSGLTAPYTRLLLLVSATICALGFGNVINDIKDAESDRINHPQRPIPRGEIPRTGALVFSIILVVAALIAGRIVSVHHLVGVIAPIILLTLYTLFLKGTPLIGNILISMLVAYSLLFGGLTSPEITTLFIPSLLAFLLNLAREIIKDVQDKEGDEKVEILTTASLSQGTLKILLIIISFFYLPLMYIPFYLNHFQYAYLIICVATLLPIHMYWLLFLVIKGNMQNQARISLLIKVEMLGGLLALAIDKGISSL